MTKGQFKKVGRILKESYAELERDAISKGIDIFSEEYDDLVDLAREKVLGSLGFTVEEYRIIKDEVESERLNNKLKNDVHPLIEQTQNDIASLRTELQSIKDTEPPVIPTLDEMRIIAKEEARKIPPVIKTEIIERTTIEKPKIVKETVNVKEVYDDSKIKREIEGLSKKIDNIKTSEPKKPTNKTDELEELFRNRFAENFEHNINILGMPDWRKLAMGLQQQIDEIRSSITGFQVASGVVDGTNNVFTFRVAPNSIVVDGVSMQKTQKDGVDNWIGTTTIILTVAPNFDIYGTS